MEKFLFLMYGLPAQATASDEQTSAYNQKWRQYMGSLAQRGALEAGAPLQPTGKTVSSKTVSEAKLETPDVYGFMVINAASLDEAIAIAREAPHMALGGTTIVRPGVPIPR
ncbi:MAG: YciI family protein [Candidatus Dormibacteraeota bacterium]|nr:YciI family protein [Candidatus Dormibacteraeota bacterium]